MLLITKLKIILQSNSFYLLLFLLLVIVITFNESFSNQRSIYDINDNEFELLIENFDFDNNKLFLEFSGKEDLIGNYYFDNIEEVSEYEKIIKYGVKVRVKGELKELSNNTIPNTFNYKKYLSNKGTYYSISIDSIEILDNEVSLLYSIKNYINDRINKIDETGYLKAFILGDKNGIDKNVYDRYQVVGITHLFALSGMHVGLLSTILFKMLYKLSSVKKYIIVDIFLLLYGFLVGIPASIRRCVTFFILNSMNKILGLKLSTLKILLLTIFIIVFFDNKIIFDTGFLYSVFTVSGIVFCNKFIKSDNWFLSNFKLSIVAFLFSLPITLFIFYEFNLLSILYNMFFIPFVSVIIYPLSLISFIFTFFYPIFLLFLNILEGLCAVLVNVDVFIFNLSFNVFQVFIFYAFLFSMFYFNKYYLSFFLVLILILDYLFPYFDSSYYVYYFDVGQGDSSLIVMPYRKNVILIDTGGLKSYQKNDFEEEKYYVSENIITVLKSKGINKVDNMILSHGDYDHMGDAVYLVENFDVRNVIFNCGGFNELEHELIKVLDNEKTSYYSCIKELKIDDNKLYFLQTKEYDNENDNSNVIYTELDGYKFMFMGDVSVTTEKEILNKYKLSDIDVLKVGHHGSKTSSSEEFIDEVNPKYSVISVVKNNRYGHPNKEVLDNLDNSKIYRTDEDGSIMFKIKNNKLKIEKYSP